MWIVMILLPPAVVAFGWTCEKHTNIAGPVVTLFASGFAVSSVSILSECIHIPLINAFIRFMYSSTLAYLVDANAGRSTLAVACNNSFRGLGGFISAEIAAPLQDAIGDGGLYTMWACLLIIVELMILLVVWKGKDWREQAEKDERLATEHHHTISSESTRASIASSIGRVSI
jgi:Na+/melibiose symporter-like transporter